MRNELDRIRWDTPANTHASVPAPPREDYALAEEWAEEAVGEARKSRNFAWVVTLLLIIICGAQAAAIAIMLPLKQIEPYTILVDKTTGYMETVRGVKAGDLPQDQAVVEALLAQYILAREAFDLSDLKQRYNQVALWSDGDARADYVASYQPGGTMAATPTNTRIAVTIKKVELLSRDVARVHFATRRSVAAITEEERDWQATVGFRFSGAPMRGEDRLINPLGFQAVTYRRDGEISPPPVDVTASIAPLPETPAEATPAAKKTPSSAVGSPAATPAQKAKSAAIAAQPVATPAQKVKPLTAAVAPSAAPTQTAEAAASAPPAPTLKKAPPRSGRP
jgi:type IV secretion system protein VirB8